jgi:dipeptidyl aminopeptidase/acylaminoacyl peptidase
VVVVAMVCGASQLLHPPSVAAGFPGLVGKLAFVSDRDGQGHADVYVADADGSNPVRLTNSSYSDAFPTWSPGGSYLAFIRYTSPYAPNAYPFGQADSSNLWVMRGDGTGLRQLTFGSFNDYAPAWSPDGSRIAFSSNRAGDYDIWVINLDGSDLKPLIQGPVDEVEPAWAPDDVHIAYVSAPGYGSTNRVLKSQKLDGTDQRTLFNPGTACAYHVFPDSWVGVEFPEWSPDGQWIAFSRNCFNSDFGRDTVWLDTVGADGSAGHELADLNYFRFEAASWSPDGASIGFQSYRSLSGGDNWRLAQVSQDLNSANFQWLTFDDWTYMTPDWQPIPAFPLVDARFSRFNADIQWVYNAGIARGCDLERYCPDDAVTRGQMAAFLDRALKPPATSTDFFTDDDGSIYEPAINRLAAAGIVKGCRIDLAWYCPSATITREQLAAFLDRALQLPPTSTDFFTDDESSPFEPNINRVAAAGITKGCTPTTYCPSLTVTRGQMAAFLHRAFG